VELKLVVPEELSESLCELPRNTRLSATTGRKKRGEESIHLEPSAARPPAGTM